MFFVEVLNNLPNIFSYPLVDWLQTDWFKQQFGSIYWLAPARQLWYKNGSKAFTDFEFCLSVTLWKVHKCAPPHPAAHAGRQQPWPSAQDQEDEVPAPPHPALLARLHCGWSSADARAARSQPLRQSVTCSYYSFLPRYCSLRPRMLIWSSIDLCFYMSLN